MNGAFTTIELPDGSDIAIDAESLTVCCKSGALTVAIDLNSALLLASALYSHQLPESRRAAGSCGHLEASA